MHKKLWYFEEVDLYSILCPYKYGKYLESHSLLNYNKNDFIFIPEDAADSIFLIAEGKVKIGYFDAEGKEIIQTYLGKGEVFGETSYLGNDTYKGFAQAVGRKNRICKMHVTKAHELSRDYVPFAFEINRRIARNVIRLQRRLEILFFKDRKKRLEELLKELHAIYVASGNEPYWVEHGLSQQEMANLIGTSQQTVSLLLRDLEREGIIELEKGRFLFRETMREGF